MGDLSKNFSVHEFRCKCGCGETLVDLDLVDALQTIRDFVDAAVIIESGFRCTKHNQEVGGVKNSQHCAGRAADFYVPEMTSAELLNTVRKLHIEGSIYVGYAYKIKNSTRAVHIDVRRPPSATVKKWR